MIKLTNLLLRSVLLISLGACQNAEHPGSSRLHASVQAQSRSWEQPFIPVALADSMIKSYLTSINYQTQDSSVRSFIIDANALRRYLTAGRGTQITGLKIMMAHASDYIKTGHFGQPCGYSNEALTVVLAGFGSDGNYIYAPENKVMDYSMPCPSNCPKAGTASGDLLPN